MSCKSGISSILTCSLILEVSHHFPSIVNIDETNIYFDMAGGLTLADGGANNQLTHKWQQHALHSAVGFSMSKEKLVLLLFFEKLTIESLIIPHRLLIVVRQKHGFRKSAFSL